MKYLTAILASIFIFLAVSFIAGLVLLYIMPVGLAQTYLQIGPIKANIPSIISIFESPNGNWRGISFGVGLGVPLGAAIERTTYKPLIYDFER